MAAYTKATETVPSDTNTKALWHKYRNGQDESGTVKKLVEHYLPLVRNVVRGLAIRYYGRITEGDMMSAGVLGLHEAIRNFPEQNDPHFNRFAVCRIRGAVLDELRNDDPLTRYQRKKLRDMTNTVERLAKQNGRSPTNEEVAEEIGADERTVEKYLGLEENALSLHENSDDGGSLEEVLPDEKFQGPREEVDYNLRVDMIRNSLSKLPERDQKLLYLRYYEELSVKEIAAVLNISSGRVSQLYNAAITKMRITINGKIKEFV